MGDRGGLGGERQSSVERGGTGVRHGDLINYSDGRPRVMLGFDNKTGEAILAAGVNDGLEVARARSGTIGEGLIYQRPQKTFAEWLEIARQGNSVDRSKIASELYGQSMDIVRASKIIARADLKPGESRNVVPVQHYKGERVFFSGEEYYLVGFSNKDGNELFLAKYDKDSNGVKQMRVRSEFVISNPYAMDGEPLYKKGRANKSIDIARYSHRRDQIARDFSQVERLYYQAGEKIDGSVLQHFPGTEILVVDFEKDDVLNRFYEDLMTTYHNLPKAVKNNIGLPEYIEQYVADHMAYNLAVINGCVMGKIPRMFANVNPSDNFGFKRDLDNRIRTDKVSEFMKHGDCVDKKVNVGVYITMGVAICRQQATIAAACMERAIAQGRAPGWVGVEIRANMNDNVVEGHVWMVALRDNGQEEVYDPTAYQLNKRHTMGPWGYQKGYEQHIFGVSGT